MSKLEIDWKHLKKVNAGYFKHMYFATKLNIIAVLIVITGIIHSIFPFLFAYTPYKLAKYIVISTEENFGSPDDT
jgi:hypothetical protein